MLLAGIKINDQATVIIPRILIIHTLFYIDVYAANGINNFGKGINIYNNIMLHFYPQQILNRVLGKLVTAVGIGSIDFVKAMSLDFHTGISRYRKDSSLVFLGIQRSNHQGIGTAYVPFTLIYTHEHNYGFIWGGHTGSFIFRRLVVKKAGGSKERSSYSCQGKGAKQ